MDLKTFQTCWIHIFCIWHWKCLMKKSAFGRMSDPIADPKASKDDRWDTDLDSTNANFWENYCPMLCQLPRLCANYGHCWVESLLYLSQDRPIFPGPSSTGKPFRSESGNSRPILIDFLCNSQRPLEPRVIIQVLIYFDHYIWYIGHLDYTSYYHLFLSGLWWY